MNEQVRPEIRTFLEKLLDDKGIKVSPELRETMISDLNHRLEIRFSQIVTQHLSISNHKALDELVSASAAPDVEGFLRDKIPNLEKLFMAAMGEFADAFLKG